MVGYSANMVGWTAGKICWGSAHVLIAQVDLNGSLGSELDYKFPRTLFSINFSQNSKIGITFVILTPFT